MKGRPYLSLFAALVGLSSPAASARPPLETVEELKDAVEVTRETLKPSGEAPPSCVDGSDGSKTPADPINDFCSAPYRTICGPNEETSRAQSARIGAVGERLNASVNRDMAVKYHYAPATDQGYSAYTTAHPDFSDQMDHEFVQRMRDGVAKEVGLHEPADWDALKAKVVRQLHAAVEAQPGLSKTDRAQLREKLGRLKIVDPIDILTGRDSRRNSAMFRRLILMCGRNGMRDNAFHPPGTTLLVLCPGFLIGARGDDGKPPRLDSLLQPLAWTLSHESAHEIDFRELPSQYGPLKACLETNFPGQWAVGLQEAGLSDEDRAERAADYLEEVSADLWAAETMAKFLSSIRNRADSFRFLKRASKTLCGDPDNGIRYPSGQFRLDVLLGRNPRVRHALGCPPLPELTPGCALEGRVTATH